MMVLSKFAGRDNVKERIMGFLAEAKNGNGTTLLVSGEAGIGKTRLVEEVSGRARNEGFLVLAGKCLYGEGSDPYLPFIDMLKTHFAQEEVEKKEESAMDEPRLRGSMGYGIISDDRGSRGSHMHNLPMGLMGIIDTKGPEGSDTDAEKGDEGTEVKAKVGDLDIIKERDRLFATVSSIILDLAANRPVMVFLDDIHWSDSATLSLVHHVAKSIPGSRIIMVCAYRSDVLEARGELPLKETIVKMRREHLIKEIKLEPIDMNAVKEVLTSLFMTPETPDAIVEKIFKETQGNPYFVEEIAKSLIENGTVDIQDPASVKRLDVDGISIPGSVSDLIGSRLANLSKEEMKLLQYASIIGDEFTVEVLTGITGRGEEVLVDELERLLESKLVVEVEGGTGVGTFQFVNKLVREVVYGGLSRARKRLLHKKAGYALEVAPGRARDLVIYQLAYHFMMGRDQQKALEYSIKAGGRAHKSFALEEVKNYFTRALEIMETITLPKEMNKKKIEILITLGEVYFFLGEWDKSLKCNRVVEQLAMRLRDLELIGLAYQKIAYIERQRGHWDISYKYYTDAMAIAQKRKDDVGMSASQRGLGYLHWRKGEFDDAIQHYEESLKISKNIDDKYNLGRTYIELGNVLNERGILAGAEFHYNTAIEILETIGDQFELARVYNNLGDVYIKKEEWENAIEQFEKTLELTIRIGDTHMRSWVYFNAAECLAKSGNVEKAEHYLRESSKLLENSDDNVGKAYLATNWGILYRFKKEWDKAEFNFKKGLKMVEDLKIPPVIAYTYIEYGMMLKDKGETGNAVKAIEKALTIFQKLNANIYADRVQKLLKRIQEQ